MRFKSIAMRIFALVIPTIIITIISFATLSYSISKSRINQTINEKMQESLRFADAEIQMELQKNATVAVNFANYGRLMALFPFSHERHRQILADCIVANDNTFGGGVLFEPHAFDKSSYYFGPYLYKERGEAVYLPYYGDTVDYFGESWYRIAADSKGELVWSEVYTDPVLFISVVTATQPFYDEEGNLLGVGTADMSLDNIRKIVSGVVVGKTGGAFILGAHGEYISFFGDDKKVTDAMQSDPDPHLSAAGRELTENRSGVTSLERNGQTERVYYMTMDNIGWTLAVTIAEKEIYSSALSSFIVTTIVPLIGLLFVAWGIALVIAYLRRIIGKVNDFARLAADGDFSLRIDVTEIDEFGVMEENLNAMISNMAAMSAHSALLLQVAENASRSKGEFLSRMSHEIRTPMNAIIGMTQIAKSSNDQDRITDCLKKIDNASKHLLALINDILDMSKIEADKLELCEEEFSLEATLANICNMMQVKAEEKQLTLSCTVNEDIPAFIIADELRFSQVATNLVGNAIKFTPEGGSISLRAELKQADGDYAVISVSVADSGIGLSDEQRARLFRSFEQGDGSTSRKFGGTGLGLAISKRIVEMMGGEISVASELGKGSVFTFTIRALCGSGAIYARKSGDYLTGEEIRNLRILVVDDSIEANEYLTHILNGFSLVCDSAFDGFAALEAVTRAAEAGDPYDIIFMDYVMPGLNGIETTKRIKQISELGTAVIMVSIMDWNSIETEAREAGIIQHITKPLSPSSVLDVINETIQSLARRGYSSDEQLTGQFREHRVLLADDIEINREIVSAFLEHTELSIDVAVNGREAFEMFCRAPDKYDVILMDIQMPEMDGIEATQRIRAVDTPRAAVIPIIAMTANALSEDVRNCRAAGMNDHIAKPLEPETLLEKLSLYLAHANI